MNSSTAASKPAINILDQFATVACNFLEEENKPVAPDLKTPLKASSPNIFRSDTQVSPAEKEKSEVRISSPDQLQRKLFSTEENGLNKSFMDFNTDEVTLCSELNMLKNSSSPKKKEMILELEDDTPRGQRKSKLKSMQQFAQLSGKKTRKLEVETGAPAVPVISTEINPPLTPKKKRRSSEDSPKERKVNRRKQEEEGWERKKRKNEWNDREIVILLQVTKIMIDCELKSVAKALFEIIERSPGKSYGRAAEKKLKRMEIFENWKRCDKETTIKNIDKKLLEFGELGSVIEPRVLEIANRYKEEELHQKGSQRVSLKPSQVTSMYLASNPGLVPMNPLSSMEMYYLMMAQMNGISPQQMPFFMQQLNFNQEPQGFNGLVSAVTQNNMNATATQEMFDDVQILEDVINDIVSCIEQEDTHRTFHV